MTTTPISYQRHRFPSEIISHAVWLYTDKLKSYDAAHREVMPPVEHINMIYANNRVEVSHQPTRQQEYHMRGFVSSAQAQRFLTLHGLTQNLFRLGRHLM